MKIELESILNEWRAAGKDLQDRSPRHTRLVDAARKVVFEFDSDLTHRDGTLVEKLKIVISESSKPETADYAQSLQTALVGSEQEISAASARLNAATNALKAATDALSQEIAGRENRAAEKLRERAIEAVLPFCSSQAEAAKLASDLPAVRNALNQSLRWRVNPDLEARAVSLLHVFETRTAHNIE